MHTRASAAPLMVTLVFLMAEFSFLCSWSNFRAAQRGVICVSSTRSSVDIFCTNSNQPHHLRPLPLNSVRPHEPVLSPAPHVLFSVCKNTCRHDMEHLFELQTIKNNITKDKRPQKTCVHNPDLNSSVLKTVHTITLRL